MQELDTFSRFLEALQDRTAKASEGPPVYEHDPRTKHAVHKVLASVHKAVFDTKDVTSLEQARQRHAACVALSQPDEDEKDGPDPKKPRK